MAVVGEHLVLKPWLTFENTSELGTRHSLPAGDMWNSDDLKYGFFWFSRIYQNNGFDDYPYCVENLGFSDEG
ncbi:MAG: hypothetical protein KDB03_21675 [Planctomycetales bacterium]|nr:hypothetical protein [Planctomycetales bacterium]